MRTLTRAALAAGATLLLLPSLALGHAQLLSSTPAGGAVVTLLPPAIVLTYDDDLTSVSSFEVVNAAGATVATGAVDPANPKSMTTPTPALANGTYEVRWTAGTSDGHIERGTFAFSVALATAAPVSSAPTGPLASETLTTVPSLAPSATTGAADAGATGSGSDVLVAIVAAAVIVAGGLVVVLRRRGA